MERPYSYFTGSVSSQGAWPGRSWNSLANKLRQENRLREAGTFVGHIVAARGFTDESTLRLSGNNYANEVQPPLSATERRAFMSGVEEVVAVNKAIGEIS